MSDLQALTPEGTQHLIQKIKTEKEDVFRLSTMPTASAENVGRIVQFVGTTSGGYTHGYFYECKENSGSYSWQQTDVQPDVDISGKEDKFRFSTMPTASADWLGKTVEYTGTTTQTYTHSKRYECQVVPESDPTAYEWVVEQGGAEDARIQPEVKKIGVKIGANHSLIPYISVSDSYIPKMGDWPQVTNYLKQYHAAGIQSASTSYTAEDDVNVLALCYVFDNQLAAGGATISMTTTGESLENIVSLNKSDETSKTEDGVDFPIQGGFSIGQFALDNDESVSVSSSAIGASSYAHHLYWFMPLQTDFALTLTKTGTFNSATEYDYIIEESGRYLVILLNLVWQSSSVTSLSVEVNGTEISNHNMYHNSQDYFYIAESELDVGDEIAFKRTTGGSSRVTFMLIKLS